MEKTDSTGLTAAEGRRFAFTLAAAFAVLGGIAQWRGRERVAIIFAVVAGLFPIATLTQLTSMGTLLAFVMVSLGVLVLRRVNPTARRPFRSRRFSPSAGAATGWRC